MKELTCHAQYCIHEGRDTP